MWEFYYGTGEYWVVCKLSDNGPKFRVPTEKEAIVLSSTLNEYEILLKPPTNFTQSLHY